MKRYMCVICGFIYDEKEGLPEDGIAPNTKWEAVPVDWVCPECGATKEDFEMVLEGQHGNQKFADVGSHGWQTLLIWTCCFCCFFLLL